MKRGRGRPKGSKGKTGSIKNKNLAFIKRIKKEGKGKTCLTLVCKECKEEFRIRINRPEIYTEEVKKNWICLSCGCKKKGKLK